MKVFKNITEMKEGAPGRLYKEFLALVTDTDAPPYGSPDKSSGDDFMYHFGGYCYLVESLEDLKEIGDEDANLFDAVLNIDIASYLTGREYAQFVSITCNSGGACYYIPKEICDKHPNIEASMLSSEGEIHESTMIPELQNESD